VQTAAQLSRGQLRLWLLPPTLQLPEESCLECLSSAEVLLAATKVDPIRRREFLGSRTLLRRILGRELGLKPSEVPLIQNEHGKPLLGEASSPAFSTIHFNFSHSEGALLLGLDVRGPIGVDIERPKEASAALMQRCLSPSERHRLDSLPASERSLEFCRIWAIKEAVLKAHGQGLSLSLSSVETGAGNSGSAAACEWWSLETESGFCAAVARLAAPQAPRSIPAPQVFRIRDWNDEAIFASA
jgi:phosphopantetheinyl transferase